MSVTEEMANQIQRERLERVFRAYDDREQLRFWHERDIHCKEELLCYSLEDLTRVVVRRQGVA